MEDPEFDLEWGGVRGLSMGGVLKSNESEIKRFGHTHIIGPRPLGIPGSASAAWNDNPIA